MQRLPLANRSWSQTAIAPQSGADGVVGIRIFPPWKFRRTDHFGESAHLKVLWYCAIFLYSSLIGLLAIDPHGAGCHTCDLCHLWRVVVGPPAVTAEPHVFCHVSRYSFHQYNYQIDTLLISVAVIRPSFVFALPQWRFSCLILFMLQTGDFNHCDTLVTPRSEAYGD